MATDLSPRTVILQSNSKPNEYFFLFFMEMPTNLEGMQSLIQVSSPAPDADGCLNYSMPGTSAIIPGDYDGPTFTAVFPVFSISDGDPSAIKKVQFTDSQGNKKSGDVEGIRTNQLPTLGGNGDNISMDYSCNGRTFVIQSDQDTSVYYAGTLVDVPANNTLSPSPNGYYAQSVLSIEGSSEAPASRTMCMLLDQPASYDGSANPKTATFLTIEVFGNSINGGAFLDGATDHYASPIPMNDTVAVFK
ncbi:MAG: hypothetical protein RLP15_04590 [Cryomorphaceae bacterium]